MGIWSKGSSESISIQRWHINVLKNSVLTFSFFALLSLFHLNSSGKRNFSLYSYILLLVFVDANLTLARLRLRVTNLFFPETSWKLLIHPSLTSILTFSPINQLFHSKLANFNDLSQDLRPKQFLGIYLSILHILNAEMIST